MAICKRCGEKIVDTRECPYCSNAYCQRHLLPENHDCPGVKNWEGKGGRFEGGFDGSR